jgi:hypothetical protein
VWCLGSRCSSTILVSGARPDVAQVARCEKPEYTSRSGSEDRPLGVAVVPIEFSDPIAPRDHLTDPRGCLAIRIWRGKIRQGIVEDRVVEPVSGLSDLLSTCGENGLLSVLVRHNAAFCR